MIIALIMNLGCLYYFFKTFEIYFAILGAICLVLQNQYDIKEDLLVMRSTSQIKQEDSNDKL